jgi:nucleotide-binding universal stress UspA family protein
MFKHLLVPLDGSRLAESALPAAAALAGRFKATVTLLHVIEKNAPELVHGEAHLRTPEQALEYLKAVSGRAFPRGISVHCHVHRAPVRKVAKAIVAHEEEFHHDLIVMCTHGRGSTSRLLVGSVAQRIIGKGNKPVLILHPGGDAESRPFSCKAILVPLDDNPEHGRAVDAAAALASAFGAVLHLLMVIRTVGAVSGKWSQVFRLLPGATFHMLEMAVPDAEAYLEGRKADLEKAGLAATARVERGNPVDVIRKTAEESSADLIVLGTHGRFGADAFLSGSVASDVCSQCSQPLLLVPVGKSPSWE